MGESLCLSDEEEDIDGVDWLVHDKTGLRLYGDGLPSIKRFCQSLKLQHLPVGTLINCMMCDVNSP